MLLCALATTYAALPESTGRIVPEWRPAVTAVVASFLIGRSAAVLLRARQEPQSDLHDAPSPPAEG
jgi:hypothetical protein